MKERISQWLYSNGDLGKILDKVGLIVTVSFILLCSALFLVSCKSSCCGPTKIEKREMKEHQKVLKKLRKEARNKTEI